MGSSKARWRIGTWLCAAAAAVLPAGVAAFDGWEHERLADLAFHLAKTIHCQGRPDHAADCAAIDDAFEDRYAPRPAGERHHYGVIVRCVDFFLTPEKMIAGYEDEMFDAPGPALGDGIVPARRQDYGRIGFSKHCSEALTNTSGIQAAHSNHSHFQSELIASQNLYHTLAMATHRGARPNLFGALLINAISDHYLHDFFAPGHIGTMRSHMSDIYSNALHDTINADGIRLRFKAEDYRALLDQIGGGSSEALRGIALERPVQDALQCAPAGAGSFLRPLPAGVCEEPPPPDTLPAWLRGVNDIRALLMRVVDGQDAGDGACRDGKMRVRGDNMLWRTDQWCQRLVMLALQTQSLLEVLRARERGDAVSAFAGAHWRSQRVDGGALVEASLDGRFEYRLRFLGYPEMPVLPFVARAPLADEESVDVLEFAGLQSKALWLRPVFGRQTVLSVGINYEMPHFGQMQGRTSVSFETPIVGLVTTGRGKYNLGVAAGAFVFKEQNTWGSGLSLRPGMVFSQTETFLSFPLRWFRYHNDDGTHAWRPSAGVRLDQGFSSFMTVYLQWTHGPFVQADRSAQSGSNFGAGIVFAAPLCRWPLISQACN